MKQMKTLLVVSLLLACAFMPGFAVAGNKAADMSNETDTVGVSNNDVSTADNETDETNEADETNETDDAVTSDDTASAEPVVDMIRPVRKQMVAGPQVVSPRAVRTEKFLNIIQNQQLESKQALLDARKQFRNAETPEEREQLRQQLRTRAQEHLSQTLDLMIERLELLQERIEAAEQQGFAPEGASEQIDKYILRLEGKKLEAESADTPADIVSSARDIRGEWREIRAEIARHTRYMIIARIGNYVEKSERLSDRLDTQIDNLTAQGVDTTSLEDKLDRFDDKIDCVRTNCLLARDGIGDGDPADVGQAVRRANVCIKDANQIIREMFRELREYRAGTVALSGTGTLSAEGSGTALVRGEIEMQLAADAGSLSVCDRAGDMEIAVTGDGTRSEDGSIVVYTGFNGEAAITGSDVVVTITGTEIDLTVDGTGTAILIGTGSYEVTDGRSGEWRNPDLVKSGPVVVSETAVESEGDDGSGDEAGSEAEDGSESEAEDGTDTGNETADIGEEV